MGKLGAILPIIEPIERMIEGALTPGAWRRRGEVAMIPEKFVEVNVGERGERVG